MKNNRIFALLSAAMLLLTGCAGNTEESASQAENTPAETAVPVEKKLSTLGDSISYGLGMEDIDTQRYSAILKDHLEARDGVTWLDYNYALSGDDSSDLLHNLQNGRAMRLPSSDIIVMCIGANNLLGVYTDYAMEKADEYNIDPANITEDDLAEIQEKFEAETADQEALQAEFQRRIDENLVRLESDLGGIYDWIRERNPDAPFYVLNVYNPYTPETDSGMMDDAAAFYDFAVSNLERLNTIIKDFTDTHSDLIFVDIAAAFAECDKPPVLGYTTYDSGQAGEMEYYDPHPNAEGQKLIAETVWKVMEQHP